MARGRRKNAPPQDVQCATCIFRHDGNQVELEPGVMEGILKYLLEGRGHLCHSAKRGKDTERTCRGGRNFQLEIWHRLGHIKAPTDEALKEAMIENGIPPAG